VPAGASGPFGPDLSKAFSKADSALVSAAIVARCDVKGRDTAKDGMVGDPEACDFDPQRDIPTCAAGNDGSCLSALQKTVLKSVIGGGKTSQGLPLYSDYFYDAGVATGGWTVWKTHGVPITLSPGQTVSVGLNVLVAPESIGKVFSTPANPAFNPFAFNPDTDAAKTAEFGKVFNATSTDLARYKARGGKLLIYHGNSDPVFSSKDTIRYVKSLAAANGGDASDFARLFLVPGMTHCSGGPATDSFDPLTAIQDWVEKGVAPDAMLAKAGATSPWPGRTRPLCAYPKVAVYQGKGSLEDAASFACR
jgi:feruloyl esterase